MTKWPQCPNGHGDLQPKTAGDEELVIGTPVDRDESDEYVENSHIADYSMMVCPECKYTEEMGR